MGVITVNAVRTCVDGRMSSLCMVLWVRKLSIPYIFGWAKAVNVNGFENVNIVRTFFGGREGCQRRACPDPPSRENYQCHTWVSGWKYH